VLSATHRVRCNVLPEEIHLLLRLEAFFGRLLGT
jgi:hypothetical protein